jgi:hypothetical protein
MQRGARHDAVWAKVAPRPLPVLRGQPLEQIFAFADGLGPTKVIHVHDPTIGLRMALDVSVQECFRFACAQDTGP